MSVFSIFLDWKSDFELPWEILWFDLMMDLDGAIFAVVESPVIPDECFYNTFTRRVLKLINFRLTLLCILRAMQSGDSNQREPICKQSILENRCLIPRQDPKEQSTSLV